MRFDGRAAGELRRFVGAFIRRNELEEQRLRMEERTSEALIESAKSVERLIERVVDQQHEHLSVERSIDRSLGDVAARARHDVANLRPLRERA